MRSVKLLALLPALAIPQFAQAWLSPQGEGTVTMLYQNDIERLHAFGDGRTKDKGHTYLDGIFVGTDFSFTDRLAVTVSLPYIAGMYVGSSPHLLVRGDPSTEVALDNGHYHGGLQDFRFNVRYSLSQRALKIVPFFQADDTQPRLSHARARRGRSRRAGVSHGRERGAASEIPSCRRHSLQGQYAFGMSPLVAANIAPKRSYGEVQLGYLLSRHITLQGSSVLTWSNNGLDFDYNLFPNNLTGEQYLNHDRISRAKLLDAAGTIAYQVNRSTNFLLSVGHSFYGTNTHLRYLVTTVGFTKAFSTKLSAENKSLTALPDENKAVVCTCAKTK